MWARGQLGGGSTRSDDDDIESALAQLGIAVDGDLSGADATDDTYYLWPENVEPWRLWQGAQTQWRNGMSGPTGLDYQGVSAYLDLQGLDRDQRRETFELLQACERATLDEWAKQRAKKPPR